MHEAVSLFNTRVMWASHWQLWGEVASWPRQLRQTSATMHQTLVDPERVMLYMIVFNCAAKMLAGC